MSSNSDARAEKQDLPNFMVKFVFIDIIDSKDDQLGLASNPNPLDSFKQTVSDKTIQASVPSDKKTPILQFNHRKVQSTPQTPHERI